MPAEPILYVEDDPLDRDMAETMFNRLCMRNPRYFVGSGGEAIDYLYGRGRFEDRGRHPFPALVLLDVSMPEMDGFEVLSQIRQEADFRSLPVVMLSNFDEPEDRDRARQLGAAGYLAKTASSKSFAYWLESINAQLGEASLIEFDRE